MGGPPREPTVGNTEEGHTGAIGAELSMFAKSEEGSRSRAPIVKC